MDLEWNWLDLLIVGGIGRKSFGAGLHLWEVLVLGGLGRESFEFGGNRLEMLIAVGFIWQYRFAMGLVVFRF